MKQSCGRGDVRRKIIIVKEVRTKSSNICVAIRWRILWCRAGERNTIRSHQDADRHTPVGTAEGRPLCNRHLRKRQQKGKALRQETRKRYGKQKGTVLGKTKEEVYN